MEKTFKTLITTVTLCLSFVYADTCAQVGIGTTTPNRMLDVRGDIAMGTWTQNFPNRRIGVMDGSLHVAGLEIENTTLGGNYSQKLHLLTHEFGVTFGRRLSINERGNVGIGVENPTSRLHINRVSTDSWIVGNLGSDAAGSDRVVLGLLGGKATIGGHNNALSAWTDLVINPSATDGNVGIGTNAPATKLDVNGKIKASSLQITNAPSAGWVLRSDAAGNASWSFDKIATDLTNGMIPRWSAGLGMLTTSSIVSTDVVGFVGIGVNSPNAKLHVNSANLGSGSDNWIAGNFGGIFGDRLVMGLLDGKPTIGGHNNGLTGWSDLIINPGGGNVGIGTNAPTLAKLMVVGSSNATFAYGWLAGAGNTGFTNTSTNPYSIYASSRIAAVEFNAFSDARIKKIKGRSNTANDLATLSQIQITDYQHIDSIAKGNKIIKKVIAQELKKVYPQAVSTHPDIIPDIYQKAEMTNGFIALSNHGLKVGDKVKVIYATGEEVLAVTEAHAKGFKVATEKTEKVFVYGREVSDFHTVDYEALSTLNISATQALLKRVEMLEKENAQLKEMKKEWEEIRYLLQENGLKTKR